MSNPRSTSPAHYRCVALIGTAFGVEGPRGEVTTMLANQRTHRSIGFTVNGSLTDDRALAAALRETAAVLEVPTVADPEPL